MNIPEGWAIKSEELVSKAHGDLGYELDYSACFSEKADFTMEVPEKIKKTAKTGYVFVNKLTGNKLQKGIDGLWRKITGISPQNVSKSFPRILKKKKEFSSQEIEKPSQSQKENSESAPQVENQTSSIQEDDNIKQTSWDTQDQNKNINPPAPTPTLTNKYSSLEQEIKSDRNIHFFVHQALRQRADRLRWIESNSDNPDLKDNVEKAKRKSDKEFEIAIEEILNKSDLDPDLLKEYMDRESRLFSPKNSIKNTARMMIDKISNYRINEFRYDGDPRKGHDLPEEDEMNHYYGIIKRAVEKKCEITGDEPEKEFEKIKQKIEKRIKDRADKEIASIKNERQFKKEFVSRGEKRGFEVRVPDSPEDYMEYALVKEVAGHNLEFSVDYVEEGPENPMISFMVDGSYDKIEGMNDKARIALALSTKRAFDIFLTSHKDPNTTFMVLPYNGDDNGEYREKAYRDMGFGDPDPVIGYMRGRIVDGKMTPVDPTKKKEEDNEEEFVEKNKNEIGAFYRLLFLEEM